MTFPVESVLCPWAGTCMRWAYNLRFYCSYSPEVKKWPAEQGYKTSNLESTNKNIGHFPSQGSDRFWSRPRQVIFLSHVTKNNRFVGKWSLMQVPAIKADDRFNEKRHTNYFYGFSWITAILQNQLESRLLNRWRTRENVMCLLSMRLATTIRKCK